MSSWKEATSESTKGWSHISSRFFSFITCATCCIATICPFRMHLSAYGTSLGLCRTILTRPNVPTPSTFISSRSSSLMGGRFARSICRCRRSVSRTRTSFIEPTSSVKVSRSSDITIVSSFAVTVAMRVPSSCRSAISPK